jgi:hypothetical protein
MSNAELTMKVFLASLLLCGSAGMLLAAQEEALWMPGGYRLLSAEEQQSLPAEEVKAISARNTASLREAIGRMTPEERQATAERLHAAGRGRRLSPLEAQYISLTTMMLLSKTVEEKHPESLPNQEARFQQLLRDQEQTTKGFPSDADSVQQEAETILAILNKHFVSYKDFYLRALKPLRARPWNDAIREAFRMIVDKSTPRAYAGGGPAPTLICDAAIAFIHAREKETPQEGSWYSLEALLTLTVRNDVAGAKRLFSVAIEKDAHDTNSRIYPLLIAEIEDDRAAVARLRPRAHKVTSNDALLDRMLFFEIILLPRDLQLKARSTFQRRYEEAHPADWRIRMHILTQQLEAGGLQEVESETTELLLLPVSVLPEPHRSEFLALKLLAMAGLGRCDGSVAEIPRLESAAAAAYPWETDPDAPPHPKTAQDVRDLRLAIGQQRAEIARWRAALKDGSLDRSPDLRGTPKEERQKLVLEMIAAGEKEISKEEETIGSGDEATVAAEWSEREMTRWLENRGITADTTADMAGSAERLSIRTRSAAGKCLLARGRASEAARILAHCVGSGRLEHPDCVHPLFEAAHVLVAQGKTENAAAIYNFLARNPSLDIYVERLYVDIERSSPGLVRPVFLRNARPLPRRTAGHQARGQS